MLWYENGKFEKYLDTLDESHVYTSASKARESRRAPPVAAVSGENCGHRRSAVRATRTSDDGEGWKRTTMIDRRWGSGGSEAAVAARSRKKERGTRRDCYSDASFLLCTRVRAGSCRRGVVTAGREDGKRGVT